MNLNELKEILQMLDERDITEFELEEEGRKLRVRRPGGPHPPSTALPQPIVISTTSAPAPSVGAARPGPSSEAAPSGAAPAVSAGASAPAAAPPPAADELASGLTLVKSPIVGTFYRSPDPSAPPFVSVGDRIKVGQVLCIIEAMKLMNEIEAEQAGEIVKVHHENGQPVQYGEPLFTLRP